MGDKEKNTKDFLNASLDIKNIQSRLMKYCAFQERSLYDVRKKLQQYRLEPKEANRIIQILIEEGFIDNQRYAKIYAKGKFRNNQWGKIKIRSGMKAKKIDDGDIESGLNEINEEEYLTVIKKLIHQKNNQLKEGNLFVRRNKIARYLIGKGFESELVWDVIKEEIV